MSGCPSLFIFTDGACSGNGKANARGGYAAVVVGALPPGAPGAAVVRGTPGSSGPTTNNRCELGALLIAFRLLLVLAPTRVEVVSDSELAIKTLEQYYPNRLAKGKAGEMKNLDLVVPLYEALQAVKARHRSFALTHVRGHGRGPSDGGDRDRLLRKGNDRADRHAAAVVGTAATVEVVPAASPLLPLIEKLDLAALRAMI